MVSTTVPNPVSAFRTLLRSDATINGMVSGRVFVADIPRESLTAVPAPMIQLRPNGGPGTPESQDRLHSRVDVRVYAPTMELAYLIATEVWRYAQLFTPRDVISPKLGGGTEVCQVAKIEREVPPTVQRETEEPNQWPVAWASYLLLTSASPA